MRWRYQGHTMVGDIDISVCVFFNHAFASY